MSSNRPLDMLAEFDGKRIEVPLKNGMTVRGTLTAFDMYLNMWLEDAESEDNGAVAKLGTILLRGDSVTNIRELK